MDIYTATVYFSTVKYDVAGEVQRCAVGGDTVYNFYFLFKRNE
jgi:hypothetical protein